MLSKKSTFLLVLGMITIFFTHSAVAATIQNVHSTASSGGAAIDWDSSSSWTVGIGGPAILPGGTTPALGDGDICNISANGLPANQTVTISGALTHPYVRYIRMDNGAVVNQNGQDLTTWGGITIAQDDFGSQKSIYNLNAGSLTLGPLDTSIIAFLPGSSGELNVAAGATFTSNAHTLVGRGGAGVLNSYGDVAINSNLEMGGLAGASATVNVYDGTFSVTGALYQGGGFADFNFYGGDIYLTGDIRGIGDYSWFNKYGTGYIEIYDVGTNTTHLYYTQSTPVVLELYVSPTGNNTNSGTISNPLATIVGARDKIRSFTSLPDGGVTVYVRGGVYYEQPTLELTLQDSGTIDSPITYKAYPGETPVISGGRRITGVTKVPDSNMYEVYIPEAADHNWKFRQIFLDDIRYTLAKSPNEGYFFVTDIPPEEPSPYYGEPWWSSHHFNFRSGDLQNWSGLSEGDINIHVFHLWEAQTTLLRSVDESALTAVTESHVLWGLTPNDNITPGGGVKRYIVENAPDSFDAPGEWYLDRNTGLLKIIPKAEEDLAAATLVIPVTENAITITGNPAVGEFVEYINFEGLKFRHFGTPPLNSGILGGWASSQGAYESRIGATITMEGVRNISLEECELSHTGKNAIELAAGCSYVSMIQNHLYDLGGGGFYIGEPIWGQNYAPISDDVLTHHNVVHNNYIHDAGIIHPAGVGVLIAQSSDNTVTNNEISYLNYTGISVGWTWTYDDNYHKRNLIAYNHIHDIGQHVLSDMAGIYTLGKSEGTVVRNNLIHDCTSYVNFSSIGIYPDQGSSHMIYENNIVYNTNQSSFSINSGSDLTVRNNIFAMSAAPAPFSFGNGADCTIERNIFYYWWGDPYRAWGESSLNRNWFSQCDNNLFWCIGGKTVDFKDILSSDRISFQQWKAQTGLDTNSIIADPLFVDRANENFAIQAGSPAFALGFQAIDQNEIGLTGPESWTLLPQNYVRESKDYLVYFEDYNPGAPPVSHWPDGIVEDFETTGTGNVARYCETIDESGIATIRVSEEASRSGNKSLKFLSSTTSAPYITYQQYDPLVEDGASIDGETVVLTFWVNMTSQSAVIAEIKDSLGLSGPGFKISSSGQVLFNGSIVGACPTEEWVRVDLIFEVGFQSDGQWKLHFTSQSSSFESIVSGTILRDVNYLKIASGALTNAAFYLDDIRLHNSSIGDINPDNAVNMTDLSLLGMNWQESHCKYMNDWCHGADINRNDSVDISDLLDLIDNWLNDFN